MLTTCCREKQQLAHIKHLKLLLYKTFRKIIGKLCNFRTGYNITMTKSSYFVLKI